MSFHASDQPFPENGLREAAENMNEDSARLEREDIGKPADGTFRASTKKAGSSLAAMQRSFLMLALGVLLAGGLWRVTRSATWLMDASQPHAQDIEARGASLSVKIDKLRRAWEQASKRVKRLFVEKLVVEQDVASEGEPPAERSLEFEDVLSFLLEPASQVQEAPIPESAKEDLALRRVHALMESSLTAAHAQLELLTKFMERQSMGLVFLQLPSLQELKNQKTDLVSFSDFLQMVEGERGTAIPEEEKPGTSRVPRVLAETVARLVVVSKLHSEAKLETVAAFQPFLEECKSWVFPGDLLIPGGGKFPTAPFIALMQQMQESGSTCAVFVDKRLKELEKSFTVDNTIAFFEKLTNFLVDQASSLNNAMNDALEAAGLPPADPFYRTLLHLLE